MNLTCEYCGGVCEDSAVKCPNCSAPINRDSAPLPDYRHCPACGKRLLALGSPACSYCGRRLPDSFIKVREGDLKRMTDLQATASAPHLLPATELLLAPPRKRDSRDLSLIDVVSDLTDLL